MKEKETLGGYLRALREDRKIPIEEMSLATRVSVGQLEALEGDRMSALPAPVFVKGFIRAYCHVLGQSPDEALGRYRTLVGAPEPVERIAPRARPALSSSASAIVISLVLLVGLGAGLLALRLGFTRGATAPTVATAPAANVVATPKTEPPIRAESVAKVEPVAKTEPAFKPESAVQSAPPTRPEVAAKVEPAAKSESGAKVGPAAKAPPAKIEAAASSPPAVQAGQRLTVKAIELTWLRIQSDDGTAAEALLSPGVTREWMAEKRFLLTVGNAGGIELTLNGQPIPPLGARGVVIRELQLPHAGAGPGS